MFPEIIAQKIQAAISVMFLFSSWFIAQFPIVDSAGDEIISIGLLVAAVVTIWKAFNRKDANETRVLEETIKIQQGHIEAQNRLSEKQQKMYDELQDMYKDLQENLQEVNYEKRNREEKRN